MELKIDNLTKEFQDITAVKNVSYTMRNGVYGLLGVNGAGKTTLMRMLCTLLKQTNGTITYNGEDIVKMGADYRKLLGYLPQDFGYYPDFTVLDYLLYISSIKGLKSAVAKKRINEMLDQVGLSKVRNKKMKKLSGGMKRRAGIAQAMLNNPQILILDEPTAGLDPNERIRFRNLISGLSQDRLVFLSTHIVSDIEYIANEILFMKEGQIVQHGTPENIISTVNIKAWSLLVTRNETDSYVKKYKVANMKTESDQTQLRILSDAMPSPDARLEDISLEDAFLYYFGGKAGEENVLL